MGSVIEIPITGIRTFRLGAPDQAVAIPEAAITSPMMTARIAIPQDNAPKASDRCRDLADHLLNPRGTCNCSTPWALEVNDVVVS
jgi:hypothetical protein